MGRRRDVLMDQCYKILESQYLDKYDETRWAHNSLEDMVNEHVKDGWMPVGEISTIIKDGEYKYYTQAVCRR